MIEHETNNSPGVRNGGSAVCDTPREPVRNVRQTTARGVGIEILKKA